MDRWILRTQDQYFLVTSETVKPVSEFSEALPCVLSPFHNFRSYLTIPEDTNRDLATVKLELLKQSLPKSPENLTYQFIEVGRTDPGQRQFLALALSDSKFRSVRNDDPPPSEAYFFEALLTQKQLETPTTYRIVFPDGTLFALFNGPLLWSRFIKDSQEKQVAMTEQYIQKNFSFEPQQKSIDGFNKTSESQERWSREIGPLLPEPDPSYDLLGQKKGTVYRQIEKPLLGFLVLLLGCSLIWIVYQQRIRDQLDRRIDEQYRQVVGESSSTPLKDLRMNVNQLQSDERKSDPTYPKIMTIDQHLEDVPFRILRMSFNESETILVGLTENLETIEQFRDSLASADRVASVEIDSSDSMNYEEYNFEVRLRVQWS